MSSLSIRSIPTPSEGGAASVACTHCGLPVPAADVVAGEDVQFCCGGCRAVYTTIHASGLGAYYTHRDGASGERLGAPVDDDVYAALDDPVFLEQNCPLDADGLRSVDLHVSGLRCAACVWLIEKLPRLEPGVRDARVDFGRRIVRLTWDPDATTAARAATRLARLGYAGAPARGDRADAARRREDRTALVRIAVAGAIAGNVMLIAFALYGGMLHGMSAGIRSFFEWTSLGLTLVSVAGPGRTFFAGAWASIRARVPHMDLPVALGIAVGTAGSAVAVVRGAGGVYFDSITVLVFLLLVGRWLQLRQERRSADAVALLFSMTPRTARRVDGDRVETVSIARLEPGDLVEVRAGETVPVDGCIETGSSQLDRGVLTGESRPVDVAPGETAHAGTVNLTAPLRLRAERTGAGTRVGQLMALVENEARRRAPIVQLVDRIAGIFVSVVLVLAVLVAGAWWWIDPSRVVPNVVALLIITCPCALGLATPLALVASIGRAARRGILVKGADVFTRLRTRGTVVLDKTGTLTRGRAAVTDWCGEETWRPLVARLERACSHPVANALAAMAPEARGPAASSVVTDRRGMSGRVDGHELRVGTRGFVAAGDGPDIPGWADEDAASLGARGASPVFVAVDGSVVAVAGVSDPVRPEARATLRALTQRGWTVAVLSGDHPDVVRAIGDELGLPADACVGGIDPEGKVAWIRDRVADDPHRPVVMVGDGVNDAAALAAATVGIGVRGGAEACLEAADVCFTGGDLEQLPVLLDGIAHTRRTVRRNLMLSVAYNVVGVSLAACGLINPLVAAILMPASSLTVIIHSFRARTFTPVAKGGA